MRFSSRSRLAAVIVTINNFFLSTTCNLWDGRFSFQKSSFIITHLMQIISFPILIFLFHNILQRSNVYNSPNMISTDEELDNFFFLFFFLFFLSFSTPSPPFSFFPSWDILTFRMILPTYTTNFIGILHCTFAAVRLGGPPNCSEWVVLSSHFEWT